MTISVSTHFCSSSMPSFGRPHAALALEMERLGDHADGQDALLAGGAGNDRRSARAGAAAHAGGDEAHVRAVGQMVDDLVDALLGRGAPDFRLRAGAETLGDMRRPAGSAARTWTCVSAWASVLATTNSTPRSPAVIMLLTALPPPPPTPKTHDARLEFCDVGLLQIYRHCPRPLPFLPLAAAAAHRGLCPRFFCDARSCP